MNNNYNSTNLPADCSDMRIAIVRTEWNSDITSRLSAGAESTLKQRKAEVDLYTVPGAVELTYAAQRLADSELYDAIIVCGCVVRGDTPHFDYVCSSVTQGITSLNADGAVPVIFCVLTVNTREQAIERCGGNGGHKGVEAAETAISMVQFARMADEL